jgi:DNA-binding MarR family transcriptional regulator
MFGEPAWDLLLLLYIDRDTTRQTIGKIANETGAAPTTLLRWIEYLEGQGLLSRYPHPTDRRSVYVQLTDKAQEKLNSYFSETLTDDG